jgi:5-methylcytosine-specific restriction endonuclease McrA
MIIKYKEGICAGCGETKIIYNKSKKLCPRCNTIRLVNQSKLRMEKKVKEGKALDYNRLNKFYKEVWDSQNKVCWESGEKLYTFHKWHIHHLLEKDKHPEAAFDIDNCVLLTLEQHSLWHHLTDKRREMLMPNTYTKYLHIKEKYGK